MRYNVQTKRAPLASWTTTHCSWSNFCFCATYTLVSAITVLCWKHKKIVFSAKHSFCVSQIVPTLLYTHSHSPLFQGGDFLEVAKSHSFTHFYSVLFFEKPPKPPNGQNSYVHRKSPFPKSSKIFYSTKKTFGKIRLFPPPNNTIHLGMFGFFVLLYVSLFLLVFLQQNRQIIEITCSIFTHTIGNSGEQGKKQTKAWTRYPITWTNYQQFYLRNLDQLITL